MNNCKITLCGGEALTVVGKMEKSGGSVLLKYEYEGDSYSVECRKTGVHYVRRGSLNLDMRLEEGKNTECLITEGGMTGAIPVFTSYARTETSDGAVAILLDYNMCGEEKTLHIAALSID